MRAAVALLAVALALALGVGAFLLLEPPPETRTEQVEQRPVALAPARADAVSPETSGAVRDAEAELRERAVQRNNEGVRLLNAGELDAALVEFEAAHALLAADEAFARNLAEGLVRRALRTIESPERDLAAAVLDLERALVLDPSRTDLAGLLERWQTELGLKDRFTTYTSIHFDLAFDGERETILQNAQAAIDVLEQAYGEFWLFFDHDPVAERGARFEVTFYEPDQFRSVTGLGHWAGGAFDGTVRLPIEDFDQQRASWSRTLRHELAHAFLDTAAAGRLPGWFEEGLAQWLEGDTALDASRARGALEGLELLPLAELAGPLSGLGDGDRITRGYAQGLLFTLYLIEQYGESTVSAMVAGTRAGLEVAESFERRIGVSLAQALADFDAERRR